MVRATTGLRLFGLFCFQSIELSLICSFGRELFETEFPETFDLSCEFGFWFLDVFRFAIELLGFLITRDSTLKRACGMLSGSKNLVPTAEQG